MVVLVTNRIIRSVTHDMFTKIRMIELRVNELERRRDVHAAATYVEPMPRRDVGLNTRADVDKLREAQPVVASIRSSNGTVALGAAATSWNQNHEAAALALGDFASFRSFTAKYPGTNFFLSLRPNGSMEPVSGPDAESTGDLWAIRDGTTLLVYPGFNLRRSQSSLVADAGRLARDRLDWLFEIQSGAQLGALRPARVRSDDLRIVE